MARILIETVQHGYRLVDCDECGVLGVWPSTWHARQVKDRHRCGEPDGVPGAIGPQVIIGDGVRGQGADRG
jgi:hypothetical protein